MYQSVNISIFTTCANPHYLNKCTWEKRKAIKTLTLKEEILLLFLSFIISTNCFPSIIFLSLRLQVIKKKDKKSYRANSLRGETKELCLELVYTLLLRPRCIILFYFKETIDNLDFAFVPPELK